MCVVLFQLFISNLKTYSTLLTHYHFCALHCNCQRYRYQHLQQVQTWKPCVLDWETHSPLMSHSHTICQMGFLYLGPIGDGEKSRQRFSEGVIYYATSQSAQKDYL